MMRLARHRAQAADLPEQPLIDLDPRPHVGRIEAPRFPAQILQDGTGLEDRQRSLVGSIGIDNGGHPAIGTDHLKRRRELLARADVHRLDHIGQPHLLQRDGDFPAVRRGPVPELDRLGHRCDFRSHRDVQTWRGADEQARREPDGAVQDEFMRRA
ncbi:hypothetical protein D3C71_1634360 [compost metagenome]